MRKLQKFLPILGAVLGLCLAGCSSTDNQPDDATGGKGGSGGSGSSGSGGSGGAAPGDGGACKVFDYTNYKATGSPTLTKDIQPLLMRSCSLASSCHQIGSPHPPVLGPSGFLLDGGKPNITAEILQNIMSELGKSSAEVPAKKFISAGKPEDSYLLNKLDQTGACAGTCVMADKCIKSMPDGLPKLEDAEITLFRDWVKTGAPM